MMVGSPLALAVACGESSKFLHTVSTTSDRCSLDRAYGISFLPSWVPSPLILKEPISTFFLGSTWYIIPSISSTSDLHTRQLRVFESKRDVFLAFFFFLPSEPMAESRRIERTNLNSISPKLSCRSESSNK